MTSAPFASAQIHNAAINHLADLSRQNRFPELIEASNSLLNENLAPIEQGIVLTILGHAYKETGDVRQATANYEKALAILERDGSHPVEYAGTLAAMAVLYGDIGQQDTAKHLLLRSVQMLEKDGHHPAEITWLWNDLAIIAADQLSKREAHKYMDHVLAELRLIPGPSSALTQAVTTTQAKIAQLDGDSRAAVAGYQNALSIAKQIHGDQHPETAMLYVLLGDAYLQAGDVASARQMTTRGLNLLEASAGRNSRRYLAAELVYSKVLEASGSRNEASTLRKEVLAGLKAGVERNQGEISIAALR
jgi:tetratricopeptide (TPR) repeat protein